MGISGDLTPDQQDKEAEELEELVLRLSGLNPNIKWTAHRDAGHTHKAVPGMRYHARVVHVADKVVAANEGATNLWWDRRLIEEVLIVAIMSSIPPCKECGW